MDYLPVFFVDFSTTVVRGLRAAVVFFTKRPVMALRARPFPAMFITPLHGMWAERGQAPALRHHGGAHRTGASDRSAAHFRTAVRHFQKSQSSSSVASALPMTYDEPEPLKKSWFSSALGERADRIAGFTLVTDDGNIAS